MNICPYCECEIIQVGEDGIDYCPECEMITEGETLHVEDDD